MTQELVAEATVLVGAFDQARNVGHEDTAKGFRVLNHADVDVQRRERIRRHLRTGRGESISERRLPSIRVAHEADISNRLKD